MMKVRHLLFVFIGFCYSHGFSQAIQRDAFYSSGGFASAGGISVQSNIGELMAVTFNNTQNALSQGFVQPDQMLITQIDNHYLAEASVFPNPVSDRLTLQLPGITDSSGIIIEVLDILGKKQDFIISGMISGFERSSFELGLKSLYPGTYIIKITSCNKVFSQIVKICKL
jgi:hypothetical protein